MGFWRSTKWPDDLLELRVVAEILGRAAPAQNYAVVSFRLDVREGDVRRNSVAGLFDVRVPPRFEIVDHGVQDLLRRRSDVHLDTLLAQAVIRIPGIERFGAPAKKV